MVVRSIQSCTFDALPNTPASTSTSLVIHPIACGFALMALLASPILYVYQPSSARPSNVLRCLLLLIIVAAKLATAAFVLDVVYVAVWNEGDIVSSSAGFDNVKTTWGNAVSIETIRGRRNLFMAFCLLGIHNFGVCYYIMGHDLFSSGSRSTVPFESKKGHLLWPDITWFSCFVVPFCDYFVG